MGIAPKFPTPGHKEGAWGDIYRTTLLTPEIST